MRDLKTSNLFGADDCCLAVPFRSAEEAWFWFVCAQQARVEGAQLVRGVSRLPRPCEPMDVMRVVDRLYRERKLVTDHLLVLRHYGVRHLPPDPSRRREQKAASLWSEAMEAIGRVLLEKGIVASVPWWRRHDAQDAGV